MGWQRRERRFCDGVPAMAAALLPLHESRDTICPEGRLQSRLHAGVLTPAAEVTTPWQLCNLM